MGTSNLTPNLFCVGNVIVDYFAASDAAFAHRYGIKGPVQHIEHGRLMAAIGELPESIRSSGGGAANVAKIAALLGARVHFTGALGTDEAGHFFERELGEAGVRLSLLPRKTPTGCCLVLNLGDSVRVAAAPAASLELDVDDIDVEDIRGAAAVVIDGYLMDRQDLVRHILEQANHCGTMVALDLSSVPIARQRAHEILTYSRVYPLILFMNEEEAGTFFRTISNQESSDTGAEGEIDDEMADFFRGLTANELFPIVAIKRGKRGAMVFAGGKIHREIAFAVKPRESTGAGDAFCAAFLSAWIRGKTPTECAALGNKVARELLFTPGTGVNRKRIAALGKTLNR
jgi:sugar/nucleoside kinase (ribokinase family)